MTFPKRGIEMAEKTQKRLCLQVAYTKYLVLPEDLTIEGAMKLLAGSKLVNNLGSKESDEQYLGLRYLYIAELKPVKIEESVNES
jgi:hypothetical protein